MMDDVSNKIISDVNVMHLFATGMVAVSICLVSRGMKDKGLFGLQSTCKSENLK